MASPARHKPAQVYLRPTLHADIPRLFEIQLDPAGNDLAGTKPRDLAAFTARWDDILGTPTSPPKPTGVTPRVIIADGVLVGSINIFPSNAPDFPEDGAVPNYLGYWLAREHWSRGIATRAIALMLEESSIRPLFARVISHNAASLKALTRNGFEVVSRTTRPATDRYAGGEVYTLRAMPR